MGPSGVRGGRSAAKKVRRLQRNHNSTGLKNLTEAQTIRKVYTKGTTKKGKRKLP